ncbi:TIGR03089 family protein [Arthrobacter livingstonensis]|uniref:TIGR03089 family protein n=1 Tax=Arthrobacter livingstonensis TaxID=670078 RepID=A0A2V5LAP5_9MICC|nr:TIGR03089 family protein [Arthrobacter livingstonensis]PYI68408.1 TIGR03089 family protein [Arthrobacter livingstonensis]
MAQLPSTVPQLLQTLRTLNPTAPRLTWYGPDSERVELSGRVLDNWVAKTANFLVDELDAAPGTVVAVDVPVHWRSLVWLLATWAVGGTALAGDRAAAAAFAAPDGETGTPASAMGADDAGGARFGCGRADIVATTEPAAAAAGLAAARTAGAGRNPFLVAVALPALAMRWMGELPNGAVDYSGEVRAHADVFFADDAPAGDATAWETPAGQVTFAQLLASPAASPGSSGAALPEDQATSGGVAPEKQTSAGAGPGRVLLQARDGWNGVVREALHIWAGGGSVVLLDSSVTATDHLRGTENITRG